MEEQLIDFVRENQFLYDKKHKHYKNAWLRDQRYEEIAKKLNVPAQKLKDRWRTLKDKFYKECKKEPSGSGLQSPRKWKWMEHLSFLKDIDSENANTTGNFSKVNIAHVSLDSITEELRTNCSDPFAENLLELASTPLTSQGASSTSFGKAGRKNKIDDMFIEAKTDFHDMTMLAKEVLSEPAAQPKSSIQMFFDGLARQVEEAKLSQYQVANLQIALLQTFQQFLPKQ